MSKKPVKEQPESAYVYVVKNPSYNDVSLCAWDSVLYAGTKVIYETKFGLDLGVVVASAPVPGHSYKPGCACARGACLKKSEDDITLPNEENQHQCSSCFGCQMAHEPEKVEIDGDIVWINHLATPSEMARYEENNSKEESALLLCREKIMKHKLNMKLVTTHFLLGEPKVLFFFTAEERVDFRDLVKDLVSVFRMRIELRQIGVRDESRLIGGLSVCGRDYCCHSITREMDPVTIKMAKEQNLSLNSVKISGPCGRLLCCLAYEYDYYMEEKAGYPPEGTRIKIDRELWKVSEINILSRRLHLQGSEGRSLYIPLEYIMYDSESGFWNVDPDYLEDILED